MTPRNFSCWPWVSGVSLARAYLYGLIGVIIFSFTLPFTRIAVRELDPVFVAFARTVVAAFAAGVLLTLTRQPRPAWSDVKKLALAGLGIIVGFPMFSALAMTTAPVAHGGVVLGLLPLATAIMGTVLTGERPSIAFWLWGIAGSLAVVIFALWDAQLHVEASDLYLLAALILASMGYAVSGDLSRKLGGWQVICWALVVALPVTVPIALYFSPPLSIQVSPEAWWSFAYLALMSQFLGFFAWNKGLALGGIAKVGQVQLLQTFFTLGFSVLLNREPLHLRTIVFALIVAASVWFGRKARVVQKPA
jgi:drug/metabolite transporter (DMT)-like permease